MFRSRSPCLAIAVLCACVTLAKPLSELEVLASKPSRCTYETAFDMYGANCAGLSLTHIPTLRGSIEILDFSNNKLRDLPDALSSYTSIKHLYLAENKLYDINQNALTFLTSLQTLDLSRNVILQLPIFLFELPSLKKLYLSGNPLKSMNTDLPISRPMKAPLELLDLSDCEIRELPNWGSMPQLLVYNISYNPLLSLEPSHFSVLCSLKKVYLTDSINRIDSCNLKPTILFLQLKETSFQLDDYGKLNTKEFADCANTIADEAELNDTYRRCRTLYKQVQSARTSRSTWLTIGGGLFGFLVCFILLLYVMHRRNVAQTKTTAEKLKKTTPPCGNDKQAATILLNDVS